MESPEHETTEDSKESRAAQRRSETYKKYNQSSKGVQRKHRYKLKQQMKKNEFAINISINGQTIFETFQPKSEQDMVQFWRGFIKSGQLFAQDSEVSRHLCELSCEKDVTQHDQGTPSKRAKISAAEGSKPDQAPPSMKHAIYTLNQMVAEGPSSMPKENSSHVSSPTSSLLSFPSDSTLIMPRVHTPSIPTPYNLQSQSFHELPVMENTHACESTTPGMLPSFSTWTSFLTHQGIVDNSNTLSPVQLPSAPPIVTLNTAVSDSKKSRTRPFLSSEE